MTRLRNLLAGAGLLIGAAVAGNLAFGGGVPLVPSNPSFSDPSQIVPTLNAFATMLNGASGPMNATPGTVSLGTYGIASGATPVTLNTQRGIASFTGVGTLVTGAVTTLTLTDSSVSAAAACQGWVQSGGAAGSGPYISTATPSAGSLAFIIANGGTTATGAAQTFAIGFNCVN